ncbi:hypothetical protein J6590_013593 [Homalodisca vitripennis]|nr:hypothetical protein J6590_013593 [Homalodisca vitripennis]
MLSVPAPYCCECNNIQQVTRPFCSAIFHFQISVTMLSVPAPYCCRVPAPYCCECKIYSSHTPLLFGNIPLPDLGNNALSACFILLSSVTIYSRSHAPSVRQYSTSRSR